jgi:pyridine nucleotide-disulfide oxidoreductase
MNKSPNITPKNLMMHMSVPGQHGLYVLGCFESRVTAYTQQMRALNLIYSLFAERRLKEGDPIAVIGTGVAGVTAAAAAAICGCKVTILERMSKPLALIDGSEHRWLHPHIYDWPRPSSLNPDAGLPLLNWQANKVRNVCRQLRDQFKYLSDTYGIKQCYQVRCIKRSQGSKHRFQIDWKAETKQGKGEFRLVILAVGFGLERKYRKWPLRSYWRDDSLGQEDQELRVPQRILVSGTGDGGLIDVLRIRINDFRHEQIVDLLTKDWLDSDTLNAVSKALLQIEEDAEYAANDGLDYVPDLNNRYADLTQSLRLCKPIELRLDTEAVLTSRDNHPLSLRSSMLNRFLFSLLKDKLGAIQYRKSLIVPTN